MQDDIILNKSSIIERCIGRINEEYGNDPYSLSNYTKQDSIILNIQRACEACIDIAMHLISVKGLGIPQRSRDCFAILEKAGILQSDLSTQLMAMVGFRNIAIHEYQEIDINIVQQIVEKHLGCLLNFVKIILDSNIEK